MLEKIEERFNKQTQAMNSLTLTFRETLKASIAYNKNQIETLSSVQNIQGALDSFNFTATTTVSRWESIKAVFNLDRASKAATEQINAVQASLLGAIKAGDVGLLKSALASGASFNLEQAMRYGEAVKFATQSVERFRKANEPGVAEDTVIAQARKIARDNGNSYDEAMNNSQDFRDLQDKLSSSLLQVLRAEVDLDTARRDSKKTLRGSIVDADDANAVAHSSIDFLEKRAKAQQNLDSALEGSVESMGKFNTQFMPKTKVDDILGSFNQMRSSLDELTEVDPDKAKEYWEKSPHKK